MLSPFCKSVIKLFAIIFFILVAFLFSQNTVFAAAAHDAASESHTGSAGSTNQASFSWTHTPTGTPRGVLVFVHTVSATKTVTTVTYGGVAMTEITGGAAADTAGEAGRIDTFFLGTSIPAGAQTITVNRTNNAIEMYASAASQTASVNTEIYTPGIVLLQEDGAYAVQSVTDGSIGVDSIRYASGYYGGNAALPAGTGSTLLNSIDYGSFTSTTAVETTAGQGARNVGFTQAAADDRAGVHLAVREIPNTAPTLSISQPDGVGDTVTVGSLYNITYSLSDTEQVVTAAFHYDTDAVGLNGTAITGACATAAEGTNVTCSWNTTGVTPGSYFVYGLTSDGIAAQVSAYSTGTITINASPAVPTVTSPTATSITSTGATLGANVTSLGVPASITERGTCWGTTAAPTTNCLAEGGTTTGIFTHARTGMSPSTSYFYRGYATNSTGTGYSVDGTFTTASITGTVSASPTTCTILSGASTCTVPFTWNISNATSPNLFNATTANTYSTSASGTGVSFPITNGSNSVQARDGTTVLASTTTTGSCEAGTSWNGSTCAATPAVPTVSTPTATSITSTGATLGATVDSLGVPASITERGTCWGTTAAPVTNCVAEGGTTTGVFTHARTGMSSGTTYFYRGYATNSTGTGYSADGTFTTLAVPTVTSPTATSITSTGATLGANVTSLGVPASITERGTCWGTTAAPTTNCLAEGGTTTGIFTHARTGMSPSTSYFYRGYATNSTGTGYSVDGTFTTASALMTTLADGTTPSSVTIGPDGTVTDLDYFTVQTNTGSDTITAATVTLLPAGAFNNIAQVDLTSSSNLTQCPSVLSPVSNTISFSSCTIPVTTTLTEYKVRITPKTHAAMPAVPGASYATTGTVTAFTSTNSQTNTDTTSATITIDNLSPNGASPVSGSGGDTNVNLNWTSSNSTDFNTTNGSVIYRWAGVSAGAEVPTEGSTATVGAANGTAITACVISSAASTALSKVDGTGGSTGCTTTALTNGQSYTYKVFQQGTRGNYDAGVLMGTFAPSATPTVTIGTGADPVATTIAPGSGIADVNYFTLQSNTGSETITSVTVDLSANSGTIDSLSVTDNTNTVLGSVSSPVVGSNTISVVGMSVGTSVATFKIRVTPFSHALMPAVPGAATLVTAPVTGWVGSFVHTGTDTNPNALTIDNLSPGNATASVTAGDTQVSVNWTNPADADVTTGGTILVLRNTSLVADTPTEGVTYTTGGAVGSSVAACVITGTPPATSCTNTGLTNGTAYHYKIFTQDSHGNYSATGVIPSNSPATPTTIVIPSFTISATAGTGGTVLPAGNTSVAQGNSQAYVITADSGYDLSTLLIDGVSIVPTSLYTFTNVQAAHTISATFAAASTVVAPSSPGASRPTTVTFKGKAFAGGSVIISKKLLSTEGITGKAVTPGTDGSFSISFVGILQGLQSFGLVAKDKNGLIAQTKLFLFDTTSSNFVEKEILIPPTIDVLYGQVTRGADSTVFGYASPNYSVHLYVNDILTGEVLAGENGFYEFKIPTGALSFGQHKVKTKQVDPISKKESDISTTRTFNVSQLTVTKADFSGDGKIDIRDWSIFLSRWLSKDAIIKNSIDLTGDRKVDISDFSIFIKTIRKN